METKEGPFLGDGVGWNSEGRSRAQGLPWGVCVSLLVEGDIEQYKVWFPPKGCTFGWGIRYM